MAVVKNMQDAVVTIEDNVGQKITLAAERGDLKFDITDNINQIKARGQLYDMTKADQEAVTGSFSIHHIQYLKQTSDGNPTLFEALQNIGAASGWISTWNDKIYTIKMVLEYTELSTEANEKITFNFLKLTKTSHTENSESNELAFEFTDFEITPTFAKV